MMKKSSLEDILSCGEVLSAVMVYLESPSAIDLSRVSVSLYGTLARNTPLGISIWRKYLTDLNYVPNRLVFDVGKALVDTSDVSRANFKLIVAVLCQKSGFMKINKLKALCASGKLSTPLLPRKGQWRALVRLDPFALKRATAEGNQQNQSECNHSTPSMDSLIVRLVVSKSKSPLLEKQLNLLLNPFNLSSISSLSSIVSKLISSNQFSGICHLLDLVLKISPPPNHARIMKIFSDLILSSRTAIGDTIFHALVRTSDIEPLESLIKYDELKPLLNTVNLNHETPLLLASNLGLPRTFLNRLVEQGADTSIPDRKVEMVSVVNSKADVLRAMAALNANSNAAKGLAEVLKSNLGPRGALKMLVGGAGQIKITKDGAVLLQEMQIQHPTAAMIARAARAQDEETGDGTTSNVLFVAELMKLSERQIADGLHPRLIADGFNLARMEAMTFLESFKRPLENDKMKLVDVARTALRTKLPRQHADQLASIVVEAVDCIRTSNDSAQVPLDLFMVEIMEMKERLTTDSRLVRGLVLDHGTRDAEMPRRLEKCFILTLNVSLEFENTEVNSTFFYSSAQEREKLVASERKFTDDKVRKIVELKNKVCSGEKSNYGFFVVNQKGIDPPSLDMLAKEGIMAVRRAKRRNMERITLACGGNALNSVDDLCSSDLGFAELVYEQSLGDDKYTFIEGVSNPQSCTILLKGPNDHEINQLKDAVRDGLRSVRNALIDQCLVPGAGSFELACRNQLLKFAKTVSGKTRLGVEIFADSLLVVPRTLAENSGFDVQETILKMDEELEAVGGKEAIGLDLYSGEAISPEMEGIFDNYAVKRQMLMLAPVLAEQMLLVDEVIRAGKQMGGQ